MAPLRSGPAWWRLLSLAVLGPVLCGRPGRAEPEPGPAPDAGPAADREREPDPHGKHLYSAEMLRHGAAAAPHFVMFFAPWWVSGAAGPGPAWRPPRPTLPTLTWRQEAAGPGRAGGGGGRPRGRAALSPSSRGRAGRLPRGWRGGQALNGSRGLRSAGPGPQGELKPGVGRARASAAVVAVWGAAAVPGRPVVAARFPEGQRGARAAGAAPRAWAAGRAPPPGACG